MARRERSGEGGGTAVRALDVDGVRTTAIITVLWAVAFVVLAFRRDELEDAGRGWWLWTCLAGVGLGLLGIEYCRKRRDAIARAELDAEADADLDGATDWQEGELAALAAEPEDDGTGVPEYDHDTGEHYPSTMHGHGQAPGEPTYPAGPAPDETAQYYPGGPPDRLPEPEPPPYSPSGRPPPGYVTGEFPAVAPPSAAQPQQPPEQPHQPNPWPEEPGQRPAQPPTAPPWPAADSRPDLSEVASPAGYSPEPDRTRRHPRDEEIARRHTEQHAPQQFAADDSVPGGLLPDDLPDAEPTGHGLGTYGESVPYDEDAFHHDEPISRPTPESSPGYSSGIEGSELLSELLGDEPAQPPSSGPDFLLDEPDDPDDGEYRGRRARRD